MVHWFRKFKEPSSSLHITTRPRSFVAIYIYIMKTSSANCRPTGYYDDDDDDDREWRPHHARVYNNNIVAGEPKDFCCCHNDNTKTKKQETRMMKIFGRFHLNNISCSPSTIVYYDDCPATTTFRARTYTRTHTHTHTVTRVLRAYVIKTESRACVRASEVYKHTNEIRSFFFPFFSFPPPPPAPHRFTSFSSALRDYRRVYNVYIAVTAAARL